MALMNKQTEAFRRIAPLFEIYREMVHGNLVDEPEQTDLGDFFADLLHFCGMRGLDIIEAVNAGRRSFEDDHQ